jgi:cytochrome c556
LRFTFSMAAALVAMAGTLAVAQKVTTTDELDKAMKRVQPAMGAANKAIQANNPAEAAKQLTIVRQVMVDTQDFWVTHKKDDAVKANKETIAKIESTEKLLTAPAPDMQAAATSLKELGVTCRSCHETYRVRDADNNWILKPGSIGN